MQSPVSSGAKLSTTPNTGTPRAPRDEEKPLTAADIANLEKNWITPELAEANDLYRVDAAGGRSLLDRLKDRSHDYSGIVFPYYLPGEPHSYGNRRRNSNLRLDTPKENAEGKPRRYLRAQGSKPILYFPAAFKVEWLQDSAVPLTFVEGEKKAIALQRYHDERGEAHGVIGLSGVYGWRGTLETEKDGKGGSINKTGPSPDFDKIELSSRTVAILFDADIMEKIEVQAARDAFAKYLIERGATVQAIDLPADGPKGIDDFLFERGPDAFAQIEPVELAESEQRRYKAAIDALIEKGKSADQAEFLRELLSPEIARLHVWAKKSDSYEAKRLRELDKAHKITTKDRGNSIDQIPRLTRSTNTKKIKIGNASFDEENGWLYGIDYDAEYPQRVKVCTYIHVLATVSDAFGDNYGKLLAWTDSRGRYRTWAMPSRELSGDSKKYRAALLDGGVEIGADATARKLLDIWVNQTVMLQALAVPHQGWHNGQYIFQDTPFDKSAPNPVCLMGSAKNYLSQVQGTSNEWRENVGKYCAGNDRLILFVSAAFQAALLTPLKLEGGGYHLAGDSSTGKSTSEYAAGSVHGGGGKEGYLIRWRATDNALEAIAERNNDGLICLDELKQAPARVVSDAVYMLANGQGKARLSERSEPRPTKTWSINYLSTGEISIEEYLRENNIEIKGGQDVRLINLPADAGVGYGSFQNLHEFESIEGDAKDKGAAFAKHLKANSLKYYGAPIRLFVAYITPRLDKIQKDYSAFRDSFRRKYVPANAALEVGRIADRFAGAAFAGQLATEAGLTGWTREAAEISAGKLFRVWLGQRGGAGTRDDRTAFWQVKKFIDLHSTSRFELETIGKSKAGAGSQDQGGDDQPTADKIYNRAGYRREITEDDTTYTYYYIFRTVFKDEVCKGFNTSKVANQLKDMECLIPGDGRNLARKHPVFGERFYTIDGRALNEAAAKILEAEAAANSLDDDPPAPEF